MWGVGRTLKHTISKYHYSMSASRLPQSYKFHMWLLWKQSVQNVLKWVMKTNDYSPMRYRKHLLLNKNAIESIIRVLFLVDTLTLKELILESQRGPSRNSSKYWQWETFNRSQVLLELQWFPVFIYSFDFSSEHLSIFPNSY